jgi:hypothetical protein
MYTLNRYGQARYAAQQNYKKLKHGFRQPAFWQLMLLYAYPSTWSFIMWICVSPQSDCGALGKTGSWAVLLV